MTVETVDYSKEILVPISRGQLAGELDRGGYWSSKHGLWVDTQLPQLMEQMNREEQRVVERFVPVALSVGQLFF